MTCSNSTAHAPCGAGEAFHQSVGEPLCRTETAFCRLPCRRANSPTPGGRARLMVSAFMNAVATPTPRRMLSAQIASSHRIVRRLGAEFDELRERIEAGAGSERHGEYGLHLPRAR